MLIIVNSYSKENLTINIHKYYRCKFFKSSFAVIINVDLLNNYVYSLVQSDRLAEAEDNYKRAVLLDTNKDSIVLVATGGLLDYRKGYPELGRAKYIEAIKRFGERKEYALRFLALLCFAREEKRAGNSILDLLSEIDSPQNAPLKERYIEIIDNCAIYSN